MTKLQLEPVCPIHEMIYRLKVDSTKAKLHPDIPGVEILLHTSTHILETATSNIAIQTQEGTWITPILDREKTPFLAGVMRGYLLDKGEITEGEVSVQDILEARKDGRRVIGFNGLRCVQLLLFVVAS